jgi:hypothetical protein
VEGSFMRTWSLFAAALATLYFAPPAHAQYRGYQYSYGGAGGAYQGGYGLHPAARPSYQYGGPSPFLWYSPHEGYSYDYQNGLPWRKNTPSGPIGRGGNSAVVRYSRPPQEANEAFYVRTRTADPKAPADGKSLQAAKAEQNDSGTVAPDKLPASKTSAATRRATATKTPRRSSSSYSSSSIRANGGGDWVPNVPSRY